MQVSQGRVLAGQPTRRLAPDEVTGEAVLPLVDFAAGGFSPSEQVLVAMDKAGAPRAMTTMQATSDGTVAGSFILDSNDATQPGTFTLVAVEESAVKQGYAILGESPTANVSLPMAAAAVNVNPVPRLIGNVAFAPGLLVVGRPTTTTYTVRNTGDVAVSLKHLVLAVRAPTVPGGATITERIGPTRPTSPFSPAPATQ